MKVGKLDQATDGQYFTQILQYRSLQFWPTSGISPWHVWVKLIEVNQQITRGPCYGDVLPICDKSTFLIKQKKSHDGKKFNQGCAKTKKYP